MVDSLLVIFKSILLVCMSASVLGATVIGLTIGFKSLVAELKRQDD